MTKIEEIKKLQKELNKKLEEEQNKTNIKENEIIIKKIDKTFFEKLCFWRTDKKIKGYVLFKSENNFDLFEIHKLEHLIKIKNKYFIRDTKIGYYKNKPLFFLDNDIPISLSIEKDNSINFSPERFYHYLEFITGIRLIYKGENDIVSKIWESIKKYWLILIIIAFILFTDEGKQFLLQIRTQLGL